MKAKYLRGFLAALLLLLPAAALADSITPGTFSATLDVGVSTTITKTVTVDPGGLSKVDVYFLADTTGSMGGAIGAVRTSAGSILSTTAGIGDVAFAVGEYKDQYDAFAYRLNTAMTTNQATAQSGINMWSATGGGDGPEAQLYALTQAAGAGTGWRAGSEKLLVWFGDAPGHDPRLGATEASAIAALNAAGISVLAIDVGSMNSSGQAGRIAAATGGTLYTGINTGSIVAKITEAIGDAVSKYTEVSLDLSEVPAGVSVVASPGSYSGSWDRSIARDFTFDVTFTGVTSGDYAFSIYGTVDGGRVATESDRITVGKPVPEPATLLLFGCGLLGLAAIRRKMN